MNQSQQIMEALGEAGSKAGDGFNITAVDQGGVKKGDPKYHLSVETAFGKSLREKANADTVQQAQAILRKWMKKYKPADTSRVAPELMKGL